MCSEMTKTMAYITKVIQIVNITILDADNPSKWLQNSIIIIYKHTMDRYSCILHKEQLLDRRHSDQFVWNKYVRNE